MAQVSFGISEKFNENWRFVLADDSSAIHPDYDDSRWRELDLPHDWSIESAPSQALASCTGYLPGGIGWYRKTFRISDESARHYIYFEGVYNRSDVYINGHHLGHRPNGYVSFLYDLTPYLDEKGDNVIAVRVDHSRYADSRWYTGSGIYRDVYLVAAPEMHLSQWGVAYRATKLTDRSATIEVDVAVDNHTAEAQKLQARITMLDAEGKQVISAAKSVVVDECCNNFQFPVLNLQLKSPHRWNLDAPYLYTLRVELLASGKVIDQTEVRAGLRTLEFSADKGFALNGKNMKVKGVCLHHDAGVLGAAVPPEVWRRRIEALKSMGANAIRMRDPEDRARRERQSLAHRLQGRKVAQERSREDQEARNDRGAYRACQDLERAIPTHAPHARAGDGGQNGIFVCRAFRAFDAPRRLSHAEKSCSRRRGCGRLPCRWRSP